MKTKMTKIWTGFMLASSMMMVSGIASATLEWQWNGTVQEWNDLPLHAISDSGDFDSTFTFDPINSSSLALIGNVAASVFEDETAGLDTYSIEFNHGTALNVLPNGVRFAYAVDFTGSELTTEIKEQALSFGLFEPNATKKVYASVADYLAGNPIITLTDTGNSPASVPLAGYSHLYIVDTINNDLTTANTNGIGVSGVPEIDALAGSGALTLLGAALALAGERRRRHLPVTGELA